MQRPRFKPTGILAPQTYGIGFYCGNLESTRNELKQSKEFIRVVMTSIITYEIYHITMRSVHEYFRGN